jgi:hypothetical protein
VTDPHRSHLSGCCQDTRSARALILARPGVRVRAMTKDLKEKRVVTTHYLIEEFVDLLAAHVPDRYRQAMRRFGLLAPRTQRTTSAAMFLSCSGRRNDLAP